MKLEEEQIEEILTRMPDIFGRESHYPSSAVLLVLVNSNGRTHILFEKRAEHITQGGEICLPGGRFDPKRDKNLYDCALREFTEETGISNKLLTHIGKAGVLTSPMGFLIDVFVAQMGEEADLTLFDRTEVSELFLLPIEFFLTKKNSFDAELSISFSPEDDRIFGELGIQETYKRTRKRKRKVYVYKTEHGPLWGITAEIVLSFVTAILKGSPGSHN